MSITPSKPWNFDKAISLSREYTEAFRLQAAMLNEGLNVQREAALEQMGKAYIALTGEMSLWTSGEMLYYKQELAKQGLDKV